ncbi:MAG: ribosome assembly cofactor RimP [Paludibacteraceae bacterium]|nr:ribosome assembly cofactor RimP [Paludibacteraceae bacterium]
MIDKLKVMELVKETLEGGPLFLVGMKITPDNRIFIDIDGDEGVTIDDCIELSRKVENSLDRDVEDFELNVSSAGADSPLKMPRQYRRHVGRELTVTTKDGEKNEGVLAEANDEGITLKTRGTKKQAGEELHYKYSEIDVAKVVIKS